MADKRKDMWKLLYSLIVNRNEIDLNDVFVCIDDILCKEPSLIRQSTKKKINKFQDTFILWLVNKLIKAMNFHQDDQYELYEKNLKVQRKLLNSCLVNRSPLFEQLILTYIKAIDELMDKYASIDLTTFAQEQSSAADGLIKLSAFSSAEEDCLKEIDENFKFPTIEIPIDDVDDYVQAFLQVLHHGLYVGYTHYAHIFENSIACILKALKECDFVTKLYCLQYVGRVFKKVSTLSDQLQHIYTLSLQALNVMWSMLPMWLQNNCLTQDVLEDFVDETSSFLDVMALFSKEHQKKTEILHISFQMLKNVYETQQQKQNNRSTASFADCNIKEILKKLLNFMFPLIRDYSSGSAHIVCKYLKLVLRISQDYPMVLRLLAADLQHHLRSPNHQDYSNSLGEFKEFQLSGSLDYCSNVIQWLENKIIELFNGPPDSNADNQNMAMAKECLLMLRILEHLYMTRNQVKHNAAPFNSPAFVKDLILAYFQHKTKLQQSLQNWLANVNQCTTHEIDLAGLILQCQSISAQIEDKFKLKSLEIILQPLKNLNAQLNKRNDDLNCVIKSFKMLTQLQGLTSESNVANALKKFLKTFAIQIYQSKYEKLYLAPLFSKHLVAFVALNSIASSDVIKELLKYSTQNKDLFIAITKISTCLKSAQQHCIIMESLSQLSSICNLEYDSCMELKVLCEKCFYSTTSTNGVSSKSQMQEFLVTNNAYCLEIDLPATSNEQISLASELKTQLLKELFINAQLSHVSNHLDYCNISHEDIIESLTNNSQDLLKLNLLNVRMIMQKFVQDQPEDILQPIASLLLEKVIQSLETSTSGSSSSNSSAATAAQQQKILEILNACTQNGLLSEQWFFHFFKMTFFYLIHPQSKIINETVLIATEMCSVYSKQPIQLWNWYKRDALSLIVKLVVFVYLRNGIRMTRSLKAFTKMLGFSCVQEFICKYYRLLVTMILPWCIKEPRCKGLIVTISKITRKTILELFLVSFLRIYTHIYLTEDSEIGNACIDLICKCTGASITKLMNTDVKQTVSEFLVYFNRNPTFVMQAFQCLLPTTIDLTASTSLASSVASSSSALSSSKLVKSNSQEFSNFIADRFLGVITYFQTCLAEPNFEKPLKEETLYSLGQIMRLIGPTNVTQFRFKIIAMLSFVLTLNDSNLQNICLKIWNIFLHLVSTQELGPSLSRIVASLQPLLLSSPKEVNEIYEYLILKNDSLLGIFVPDVYFLEEIPEVDSKIRQIVRRQTEVLRADREDSAAATAAAGDINEKLSFLYKQICNENLQVRIYGLDYLRRFIAKYRNEINHMILNSMPVDPLIEKIVDELIKGCRHEDPHMNLASAKCLGELGAIDPSYMSSNFSHMSYSDISLSIHTDDFACMALSELCKAYQFQKDTKYVDNFSLAIQETLSVFGISPKENKKMNVWESLPVRMQQVMEPLLSSCYTGSRRESKFKEHPLFNSSVCRNYEDWSFAWACRLIDLVESDETKHLLNSYKPSIKRDSNILAIFFPYILLHAIQDCKSSEQVLKIYEEFMAVLDFSAVERLQRPQRLESFKEFKSTKYSADHTMTVDDEPKKVVSSAKIEAMKAITQTSTKLCSEQMDFLQRWAREWEKVNMVGGKMTQSDSRYANVAEFLKKFDKSLIARANYKSAEYARALLYLEQYIEENRAERLDRQLSFLIEIHGKLMDADSVEGAVYMKKTNLTLDEEILVNHICDKPQETINCYEQLLSDRPSSKDCHMTQEHIKGMIDCYLRMDTPETALLITDGLWQKLDNSYTNDYFKECRSELLWRLGRYDELEELLEDSAIKRKTTNWNIQCAESFLLFRKPAELCSFDKFQQEINQIRSNVVRTMRSCSGISDNSYSHSSYDEAIRLHLLNELETNKELLNLLCDHIKNTGSITTEQRNSEAMLLQEMQKFFHNWNRRLEILQPIAGVLEPVYCFRRNLLLETQRIVQSETSAEYQSTSVSQRIDEELGKLWLRSIQMNREAGCLQQAQISIMKAEAYKPITLFLEKAKLLWQKGDQANCFKLLEENIRILESSSQGDIRKLEPSKRLLYAEAKFLQANYNAEAMNICSELNLRYFKETITANRTSEKYLVHYAQYMEKVYESYTKDQKEGEAGCGLLLDIMLHYAKSLKYGYANVYQSLPRLLSIWLDHTSQLATMLDNNAAAAATSNHHNSISSASQPAMTPAKLEMLQSLAKKMNDLIVNCVNMLPTAIFYTAFSQLLSRICHPSNEVFANIRNIVIKLIEHFPQQSLWMLLPIFKSCHNSRIKRCRLIFTDSRLHKQDFQRLLSDFNMLGERLIELTNKEVSYDRNYELSNMVRQLPRLFQDQKFSRIMLPFEKYMQPSFPITSAAESSKLNATTAGTPMDTTSPLTIPNNPFPATCVYIRGIAEEVVILRSAAKPKKITIQCSDGKSYNVMVKPKDDLRKDCRLMEFNGLVKKYLHQDSHARNRRLRIRTYAVIPFNEECGLVEWLPNLNSYRGICMAIYRTRGFGIPDRMIKQCAVPKTDPIEKKRSMYLDILLVRHPPVFHEWFRQRFPSPHSWYEARSSYVKTIAVMSMVGYILGLGDRHGENILYDETNGDAVHVDFNCLFNQGECFAYPEVVPFRLTRNMTYAMGPLGVEGLFRKCCEITLRVLKDESKTLMSILRPFVYDLGNINRLKNKTPSSGLEITDPKAITDVRRIEERLQGYVKRTLGNCMPLSTEGQVNFLISEATDVDNLASMYIGWGSYI